MKMDIKCLEKVFRQMLVEQKFMEANKISLHWETGFENCEYGLCVSYDNNYSIRLKEIHPYDLLKCGFVPSGDNDSKESFTGRFNRKSQTSAFLKGTKRFIDFVEKLKIYVQNT